MPTISTQTAADIEPSSNAENGQNLFAKFAKELQETAMRLATPGKGILAADESMATIGKRFAEIGIANSDEMRRSYREMLFGGARQLSDYISGVILHEETVSQMDSSTGRPLIETLRAQSIMAGVKVDRGLVPLAGSRASTETVTQGIEDLRQRCDTFYAAGCRFAKWRAVLRIADTGSEPQPSPMAVHENAQGLARYAAICQQCGLVPIVEPEVLADGTHCIERCQRVSEMVYAAVVKALHDHGVMLEGILLKPNMITAGQACERKNSPQEVALHTVSVLTRTIPPAVPGIMFLSGGQSEEEATINLNAINRLAIYHNNNCSRTAASKVPWSLSFSFGRALQRSALAAWAGRRENVSKAQQELLNRAKANSAATLGKYEGSSASHCNAVANKSNFVPKHTY